MIIECINCNKRFEVNSELIPSSGRTIQCGSCNHIWFFDPQKIASKHNQKIPKQTPSQKKTETNKFPLYEIHFFPYCPLPPYCISVTTIPNSFFEFFTRLIAI